MVAKAIRGTRCGTTATRLVTEHLSAYPPIRLSVCPSVRLSVYPPSPAPRAFPPPHGRTREPRNDLPPASVPDGRSGRVLRVTLKVFPSTLPRGWWCCAAER